MKNLLLFFILTFLCNLSWSQVAAISSVKIQQNFSQNGEYGMLITVECQVNGMQGKTGTVTAYFEKPIGKPFVNSSNNEYYKTSNGQIAAAASISPDVDERKYEDDLTLFIPYSQLPMSNSEKCYFYVSIVSHEDISLTQSQKYCFTKSSSSVNPIDDDEIKQIIPPDNNVASNTTPTGPGKPVVGADGKFPNGRKSGEKWKEYPDEQQKRFYDFILYEQKADGTVSMSDWKKCFICNGTGQVSCNCAPLRTTLPYFHCLMCNDQMHYKCFACTDGYTSGDQHIGIGTTGIFYPVENFPELANNPNYRLGYGAKYYFQYINTTPTTPVVTPSNPSYNNPPSYNNTPSTKQKVTCRHCSGTGLYPDESICQYMHTDCSYDFCSKCNKKHCLAHGGKHSNCPWCQGTGQLEQ